MKFFSKPRDKLLVPLLGELSLPVVAFYWINFRVVAVSEKNVIGWDFTTNDVI